MLLREEGERRTRCEGCVSPGISECFDFPHSFLLSSLGIEGSLGYELHDGFPIAKTRQKRKESHCC